MWWFANPAHEGEPDRRELAAVDWRKELLDLCKDVAPPLAAIIEATPDIAAGWPTHDVPTLRRWHDGKMIVVGDAAHAASPSSGQGASMAIEDAVVVGNSLRDFSSSAEAFAAYESLRRKRFEKMVAHGRRNGTGKTPGAVGRVIRDAVLKMFFRKRETSDPMAWIYADSLDWSSPSAV